MLIDSDIIKSGSATHSDPAIAIETKNLSRAVVGKVLVNDISVQVQHGAVLALVGPSGAGKSSFLRLLNRLDEPTGGTVLLNGRNYRDIAPRALRRRVGMVCRWPISSRARWARTSLLVPGNTMRPSRGSRLLRYSSASACLGIKTTT